MYSLILTKALFSGTSEACVNSNYIWKSAGKSDFCRYEISEQASRHNQFQMQVQVKFYNLKMILSNDRNINIILFHYFPFQTLIAFNFMNWAYTYTYTECHHLVIYSLTLILFLQISERFWMKDRYGMDLYDFTNDMRTELGFLSICGNWLS